MRGIYNLETLKKAVRDSVVNKFFWALFSFGVFVAVLYMFIAATVFSNYYLEEEFKELLKMTIGSIGFFFFLLMIFTFVMLRIIFKPFEDFFVWVKKSNFRSHINVPEQIPLELAKLYHLINSAVDDLHHVNNILIETEKSKAISVAVHMVVHEVRRPLTMMQALLHLSKSKMAMTDKQEVLDKCLSKVEESLDDSGSLINNILSFGNEENLEICECSLIELIMSALELVFYIR